MQVLPRPAGITISGTALYNDRYVKVDGQWRIAYTGYKRLLEQMEKRDDRIQVLVRPTER